MLKTHRGFGKIQLGRGGIKMPMGFTFSGLFWLIVAVIFVVALISGFALMGEVVTQGKFKSEGTPIIGGTVGWLKGMLGMQVTQPVPGAVILQPGQPAQYVAPTGTVSVRKPIKFFVVDKYAGSGVASGTVKAYKDLVLLETLTTASDGTITTGASYSSGTIFDVRVTKSSADAWYKLTIPQMERADAESMTVNPVQLDFYSVPSTIATGWTLSIKDSSGNSYATGAKWAKTNWFGYTPAANVDSQTISIYQGTDNKGFMTSFDPLNKVNWNAVLYVVITGTGYENVVVNGWDASIEKGTSLYAWKVLSPESITKWKVGNEYKLSGSTSFTCTVDITGLTVNTVTATYNMKLYADPQYFTAKGTFGPDATACASSIALTLIGAQV